MTRFGGEYGFVFKRLPVQRVLLEGPGGTTAFIDTADGAVSAVIDDADRREGWLFANVHKHDWMVPLVGRAARDAIAAHLDKAVGTSGGPIDQAKQAAWLKALREISEAALDVTR